MPEAFDKAWGVAKTRGFDIRDHNGEDDNFDILADILETDEDGVVEEYERLKEMFDKPSDPLGDALDTARSKKRKPLPENLGGMVRTGSAPRGSRVPRRKYRPKNITPPGYRDPPPSDMDVDAHMMPVPKPKKKPTEEIGDDDQ